MDDRVQYAPLLQSISSDDEDELFDADTRSKHQEGRSQYDVIHLKTFNGPHTRAVNSDSIKYSKKGGKLLALLLMLFILILCVAAVAVFWYINAKFTHGIVKTKPFSQYGDWSLFFNNSASELSVTLMDADGDNLDDIVVGKAEVQLFSTLMKLLENKTMREICEMNKFDYPCGSQIVALRGYDREKLWQTHVRGSPLFVDCQNLDVNADGKVDCIITGRGASVQAVDRATGKTLWVVEAEIKVWSGHFIRFWNVYKPLVLPDIDGDGIRDILIVHGGDQRKNPEDHNRQPGRVIFLSGATGKPIGYFLEMPESKESYMSPVAYTKDDGSIYFFFGSGGETIPGDFMVISYPDLYHRIMGNKAANPVPGVNASNQYTWLSGHPIGLNSLYILYKGQNKGVMVPPVLVDVTGDGILDILLSSFDGIVILFNGVTLQAVWRRAFSPKESYCSPTPGHYDEDQVLDFMMVWYTGEYPDYTSTSIYIISGKDGQTLWESEGRMMDMISFLSLRTTGPQDMFLFYVTGQTAAAKEQAGQKQCNPAKGQGSMKTRHIGGNSDENEENIAPSESFQDFCKKIEREHRKHGPYCGSDLTVAEMEIFLMDKHMAKRPVLIYSLSAEIYKYMVPFSENVLHCHPLAANHTDKLDMCSIRIPKATTGAIGDVDGDGELDLIQLTFYDGSLFDDQYAYYSSYDDAILQRISLTKSLKRRLFKQLDLCDSVEKAPEPSAKEAEFLDIALQPWRQYMGSKGDSVYRV